MRFVILKIEQRQHKFALVPYPGYFGSEVYLRCWSESDRLRIKRKKDLPIYLYTCDVVGF